MAWIEVRPYANNKRNRIKKANAKRLQRMRLQFIYHGEDNNIHPFYVKSNWQPPVQKSVALESYLEEIKTQLAQIPITKPKHNLPLNERKAITELKNNSEINIKRADKDTTTVIMHKQEKAKEGQVLLDDRNNYTPLEEPMVEETFQKVKQITEELYQGGYIDEMTVIVKELGPEKIRFAQPTLQKRFDNG